jgi:hypothetical protein
MMEFFDGENKIKPSKNLQLLEGFETEITERELNLNLNLKKC